MINSIEDINIANGNIILDGYAFLLGMDSTNTSVSLLLLGVNSGNEVWPDIEQINRPDVNTYFLCEYNYEHSGFRASLEDTELKDDECYEIIINIDYSVDGLYKVRKTVSSNRFILNGKLYVYNPSQFDKPDLELQSELLRKVFSDGQLCFYHSIRKRMECMYINMKKNCIGLQMVISSLTKMDKPSFHIIYILHKLINCLLNEFNINLITWISVLSNMNIRMK